VKRRLARRVGRETIRILLQRVAGELLFRP